LYAGDDDMKNDYQARVDSFDPRAWWAARTPTLEEIAQRNTPQPRKEMAQPKLYNAYKGLPCARQLDETVEQFLRRLPPASTEKSDVVPWIRIANPYTPPLTRDEMLKEKPSGAGESMFEAPLDQDSQLE
jgi:hypothetical protein